MSDLEEQKKVLVPILQRAAEIQEMEPKVAYYCRMYALMRALELPNPAEPIRGLIKSLFEQCEKDKPNVAGKKEEDREYVRNFAVTVFNRADKLDRAKRADINTAKCYYAAAIFLQVLEQFLDKGEDLEVVEPEAVEKARYALWRAAELRKALREGRDPIPPPDPADMAAAAAAAGDGPYGSSGGGAAAAAAGGGDLFAGPAYQAGGYQDDAKQQQQPPPAAPPVTAGDTPGAAVSSTEELLSLPRPPTTVPPAGSVGLVEAAAAVGPRFKQGSPVWCGPGPEGPPHGPPLRGTVGQVVSAAGAAGGQALYKVALPEAILEVSDSQLAPAVNVGARVMFVAAVGEHPQPATVLALQTEHWPCRYLLQLDTGTNVDATGGQVRLDAPAAFSPGATHTAASAAAGPYPGITGITGIGPGTSLPAAPPLVDARSQQQPAPRPGGQQQQHHHHHHHQGPPAAPSPHGGTYTSSGGGSSYPSQYGSSSAGGVHTPAARQQQQQQQPAAVAPAAAGAGVGAAAALQAAVQAAASGAYQPPASAIAEAQKYAKFAVSSLNHDDVAGAVKFLSDALRTLMQQ